MTTRPKPAPLWNPYFGGVLLGLVLFAAFLLSGHGIGASGGIARLLGAGMNQVAPEHVQTNFFFARYIDEPLSHWIVPMILGIVLGGFVSARLAGRARVETLRGPGISPRTRWIFALLGGAVAGYGARLARGCTSGQALTGGASLSVGSWAFMMALFAGGYASAWFARKLWN